jgi:hypothetical protein
MLIHRTASGLASFAVNIESMFAPQTFAKFVQ